MSMPEPNELKLEADLVFYVSAPSHGSPLSAVEWAKLAERAAAIWQDHCEECALPVVAAQVWRERELAPVRQDGLSVVRLRSGSWCPDTAQDRTDCYDPARRAITHIYPDAVSTDSSVTFFREADIEINLAGLEQDAPHSSFSDRALATLIHEVGHVWGLPHSCAASLDVSCQDAVARRSVMYPHATDNGRALVLVPSAEDLTALGAKYSRERVELGWSAVVLSVISAVATLGMVFKRRANARNATDQALQGQK